MTSERSPCFDSEGNIWVKVGHSDVPKSFGRAMTLVTDLELCSGGAVNYLANKWFNLWEKVTTEIKYVINSQSVPRELDDKDVLHFFND